LWIFRRKFRFQIQVQTTIRKLSSSTVAKSTSVLFFYECSIQGVLISTSERTRQFMKLLSITFCKIRKTIPTFFVPQFLPNESFCVIDKAQLFVQLVYNQNGNCQNKIDTFLQFFHSVKPSYER
jgi:hypothetical protein